jgi:hypothetical protein
LFVEVGEKRMMMVGGDIGELKYKYLYLKNVNGFSSLVAVYEQHQQYNFM